MPAGFSVDTHLFRELGEMLVGRDSTALVELIKNAYDADATLIRVAGHRLEAGRPGVIYVEDDGTGMTPKAFEKGFLRIASRLKEEGDRRSKKYGRRFTGAKGVGRLAAHKLAASLAVESVPDPDAWSSPGTQDPHPAPLEAVTAIIDWDEVESKETIEAVTGPPALTVEASPINGALPGTRMTLSRLRRPWTPKELMRFVREVQSFKIPEFLSDAVPQTALPAPLLFEAPHVRDVSRAGQDPGFEVRLEGDFDTGEDLWQHLVSRFEWVVEIDTRTSPGQVLYAVAPTKKTMRENRHAKALRFKDDSPPGCPAFHARIFVASGDAMRGLPKGSLRWARDQAGVRIYMEGFRVLPYGDTGNDWLGIDKDYAKRTADSLPTFADDRFKDAFAEGTSLGKVALSALAARSYFGGVFLVQDDAPELQMLVNREGFLPNRALDAVEVTVRAGIDLSVRVRAAARGRKEAEEKLAGEDASGHTDSNAPNDGQESNGAPSTAQGPSALHIGDHLSALRNGIRAARASAAAGDLGGVEEVLATVEEAETAIRHALADVRDERALLRTVASVGTQMASFTHDLNGLIETSRVLSNVIDDLASDSALPARTRRDLRQVRDTFQSVRQSLDRFASYLIDVVSPDARRRRSRQPLADRVAAAWSLVERQAAKRRVEFSNEVDRSHRTPPMFPAELTSVLLNVLTNAIKAAEKDGRIAARSSEGPGGTTVFTLENTGVAVDVEDSEVWFRPFESTTAQADPVLGQGMGLGLPIVRRILEEVDARIRFAPPSGPSFATSIEITFPAS